MKPIFSSFAAIALAAFTGQPLFAARDDGKPTDGRRTNDVAAATVAARGGGGARGGGIVNRGGAGSPRVSRSFSGTPNTAQSVRNPLAGSRPGGLRSPRMTERSTVNASPSPAEVQARNNLSVRRAEVARQTNDAQRSIAAQRVNTAAQTLRARQAATSTQNSIAAQRANNFRNVADARRNAELRGAFDHRQWDRNRENNWRNYRYFNAPDLADRGWDRGRIYSWNNHRYHWFDGAWVLIDPGYDYGAYADDTSYAGDASYADDASATTLAPVGANLVAEVQFELQRAGYNPGPADGVMGGHTQSAIAQYQSDNGLAVTGRIDQPLLASLGIQS